MSTAGAGAATTSPSTTSRPPISPVTGVGGQQIPLNFEQIKEVKLITNNFSAEYGRNANSQLLFITRGGSNQFHGAAFEFLQNNAFNARDFFDRSGNPAVTRYNDFGYALGGPIVKNKTHFFTTYEGTQVRGLGGARIAQVPTPAHGGGGDGSGFEAIAQRSTRFRRTPPGR